MIQFDFRIFFSWVETTTTPKGTPFDEIGIRVLTTSLGVSPTHDASEIS